MVSPDPPFFYALKSPFYHILKKPNLFLFVFTNTGTFFILFTKVVDIPLFGTFNYLFVYIC